MFLARSILLLGLLFPCVIAHAQRDEEGAREEPPQDEEQPEDERRVKREREETKPVEEWQKHATFDESVLAPRFQTRTPTLAAPETDVGLSLGTRELGVAATNQPLTTGLRIGPRVIQTQIYMLLTPELALRLDSLRVTLQAPLNLLLLEPGTNTFGRFALRARDWDQVSDYVQILRSLELSAPGIKLTADAFTPRTLLYGHLMNAYQPSLDLDHPSTGVAFLFERRIASFKAVIADVTFDRPILGAVGTFHPFELITAESTLLQKLGVSFEIAGDLRTPSCIRPNASEQRCIRAFGNRDGVEPETLELRDDTFVATSKDDGLPYLMTTNVFGMGTVVATELYRSNELLLQSQASWHTLLGGGHGFALGVSLAGTQHRAIKAEARLLTERFIFGYFDTLYEVEKIESFARAESTEIAPTRYQAVFGDDEAAVEPVAKGVAFGYRLAASWQFFPNTPLTLTAGFENTSRRSDTRIYFHADFQAFERIHVFGTVLRVGTDAGQTFERTRNQGGLVLLSGAKTRIWDTVAVGARYAYLQALGHAPGAELHLGDDTVATDLRYPRERIFAPQHTIGLEVELRWDLL